MKGILALFPNKLVHFKNIQVKFQLQYLPGSLLLPLMQYYSFLNKNANVAQNMPAHHTQCILHVLSYTNKFLNQSKQALLNPKFI